MQLNLDVKAESLSATLLIICFWNNVDILSKLFFSLTFLEGIHYVSPFKYQSYGNSFI